MDFFGLMYIDGYLQTWAFVSRAQKIPIVGNYLFRLVKWMCGKISGHQPSKTEWGYGGGDHGDVWCRWCNQIGRIPRSELSDRYANARKTIWEHTGCDIKQPISPKGKNGVA